MTSLRKPLPIQVPDHGPTLIDLRPPKFADGTPPPWTPLPKLDPPPFVKTHPLPGLIVKPPVLPKALPKPANDTELGIIPRSAVLQAVARIEAERAGVPARQEMKAPAIIDVVQPQGLERWSEYRELGLGPTPSKVATKAAKLVVSSYRLLGFAILTLIVVVLVGYIATTAFYFFNKSWVVPTVVSPSDEKVVQLQSEQAAQQNTRDKIATDLDDAERAIAAEQMFQIAFIKAIKNDLDGRQAALEKVKSLAVAAAATRVGIRNTNEAYAAQSTARMKQEYDAGLIDRQAMLAGKFQLAQINSANLSLAERQSEYETRARDLADAARSLDAILANRDSGSPLSYDVLKIKRDYDASQLALAKAVENRDMLKASLARQQKILDGVAQSAYLRAVADQAVVAVVPYDNLGGVQKGTKLYSCRVAMVVCHEVGSVLEVLPGEVQFKHPHRDAQLRGKMLELKLTDAEAGQHDVLFLGGAPLFF